MRARLPIAKRAVGPLIVLVGLMGLGLWARSAAQLEFVPAQVATTFAEARQQGVVREAIKAGLERHSGPLDLAVEDFTDVPLELVLVRLSNDRPVRLLLGRGGPDPQAEIALCEEMQQVLEVRFLEGMNHRFAVVGGQSVVLTGMDWVPEALGGGAQAVLELESPQLAQAYQERFEALWQRAQASCRPL